MRYQLLERERGLGGEKVETYRVWQDDGKVETVCFIDRKEIYRVVVAQS